MSTLVVDTLTGKSTATTLTIGSTPVVSASANSLTIRGEGSAQTSVQQGLAKAWACQSTHGGSFNDSYNYSSATDTATGKTTYAFSNNFANADYAACNTHYNRAAGPSDAAHHTTSQHQCDWFSASAGAVADINTDASTQVCGDLA